MVKHLLGTGNPRQNLNYTHKILPENEGCDLACAIK